MIIHLYFIRVFIYICYDGFNWEKKTKCGGCCEKKWGGVCRRGVKKTKCGGGGGGLRKKIEGGGMPQRG